MDDSSDPVDDSSPDLFVLMGDVGKGLHGANLHDAASVRQVSSKDLQRHGPIGRCQAKAREHLGDVPSHFLLLRQRSHAEEESLVAHKEVGPLSRDLLRRVG